jgi:sorbitol-specific phosphotransferase system component IIBC
LIIIVLLTVMLSFGLTAASSFIGERVLPDASSLKQNFWGTVVLCFACALPFVGWFLLLPYIGFVGIGAFILGIFQREAKA